MVRPLWRRGCILVVFIIVQLSACVTRPKCMKLKNHCTRPWYDTTVMSCWYMYNHATHWQMNRGVNNHGTTTSVPWLYHGNCTVVRPRHFGIRNVSYSLIRAKQTEASKNISHATRVVNNHVGATVEQTGLFAFEPVSLSYPVHITW